MNHDDYPRSAANGEDGDNQSWDLRVRRFGLRRCSYPAGYDKEWNILYLRAIFQSRVALWLRFIYDTCRDAQVLRVCKNQKKESPDFDAEARC